MKRLAYLSSLLVLSSFAACSDEGDVSVIEPEESVTISFDLGGEFSVEDAELTRTAPIPDYYYVAVSADASSDGKISSGYVGYFTTLSGVSLSLAKGTYNVYISAYKQEGYTIDWAESGLTEGEFSTVTSATVYAPDFADQKVDRYYGTVSQAINTNTSVSVSGKRFAYGLNVDIATPLVGKVEVSSTSPALSYTVTSTDNAKVEQNIFSLAGEDASNASKTATVTVKLYDASNALISTASKDVTIARNHQKTIKVNALNPTAGFIFTIDGESMTDDGNTEVDGGSQGSGGNSGSGGEQNPPSQTHEYVDMGFKDANGKTLYWATCNIGATNPEDNGLYFAWGETTGYVYGANHSFDWANYTILGDGGSSASNMTKYNETDGKTVLEATDDAARVLWGEQWRIPTKAEMKGLKDNCDWTWDPTHFGYKVKSKENQKEIFLPAAGYCSGATRTYKDSYGFYWTSTRHTDNVIKGWCYKFEENSLSSDIYRDRSLGISIRPVFSEE